MQIHELSVACGITGTPMPKRILIVDDSEVIRARIASFLAEVSGMNIVGEASNARDGYDLFNSLKPDTIILDIRMPGENGIKLLGKIKLESPNTRVIILTNYPDSAYRRHCEKLGADCFLDKSTEFEKLADVV